MAMAGLVLAGLSGLAMLVFGIQILVRAFRTSIGWGLASLFIPLAVLVFVFKHWPQTRKPFLGTLACLPLYAVGFALIALRGGMNRTQINGDPPSRPGFHDACAEVADKLGLGRIQFNWNAKAPRVRFQTPEGPVIDLELVKVG